MKINYYGYFTPFGGYGIVNLYWVKHLRRQGIEIFPHRKFEIQPTTPEWEALDEEEKSIFSLPFKQQRVGIIETTPFDFNLIDTPVKICNTMCEADLLGPEWIDAINQMDFVIVPNQWNKDVFVRSGISKNKIVIIPHGQDIQKFAYKKRKKKDIFTFGTVGYLNDRKGVFELIQAFVSEFAPEEPVRLYLKSSNKFFGYYQNFSDPRIITDVRHLSLDQIRDLYYGFDCFVFPSKAEGVGNPPREALATGCPIIVTRYSGLEEIALPEFSYPLLPSSFTNRTDMIEQPGKWANIDVQELMYQMRYVYEHQEEAAEKARLGSKFIADNFSWEKVTGQLIDFLKTV